MGRRTRTIGIAIGTAAALGAVLTQGDARDAWARSRSRSKLKVVSVSIEGRDDIQLNEVIEVAFNKRISKSSLKVGSIAVAPYDSQSQSVGELRPAYLKRKGKTVMLVPVLPSSLVDPGDAHGGYYPAESPKSDPFENSTLRPDTEYRLIVAGRDEDNPVKGSRRARLTESFETGFRTADGISEPLFAPEEHEVEGPPQVLFANPPDRPLSAAEEYARMTGTQDVPKGADITLFLNGLPLDPASVLADGAVQLLKIAPLDPEQSPVPVDGDVVLEQDRVRTTLAFRPTGLLEDDCTYALRIADTVTDLSGERALADHAGRSRLQEIYSYLAGARAFSPETPPEQLPDSFNDLIFDWPGQPNDRGPLKANILTLGDAHPALIDPRVFVVLTARVEPVTNVGPQNPAAKKRRSAGSARLSRVVTPLGLQGTAGGDGNVVVPFTLFDSRGRTGRVEMEYGIDVNRNGVIEDEEFFPATVDRLDPRTTGLDARPGGARGWRFVTAPNGGRSNAIVWNSARDLLGDHRTLRRIISREGREIEDPDQPGSPLFDAASTGVEIRIRSLRGKRQSRDWVYSEPFELVNGQFPDITLDDVTTGASTEIAWSAIDPDSEDVNGNGEYDPAQDFDLNGNGLFDTAPLSVHFDYAIVGEDDVSELTPEELAQLDWQECRHDESRGDPDLDRPSSPVGRPYVFAWDHAFDGVVPGARVILRGRTFDETRLLSDWVYLTEVVTVAE